MAEKKNKTGKTGVTGGGEFSEGGGPGRTSETQGNRDAMSGSSSSGSGSKSSSTGFETSRQTSTSSGNEGLSSESGTSGSGKSGRYTIDCAEAGGGCSLRISGTYDEVLAAGVEHGRSAHGMSGDDKKLRDDIKGYVKEDSGVPATGMPGSYQGRGESQSGASPRPS